MPPALSPQVQHFIAQSIHSLEQLEILCLVSSDSSRAWTVAEVFRRIQSSEASVSASLRKFQQEGILESRAGGFQFLPAKPTLADTVRQVARAYRERPVAVVETIYRKPPDAVRDFAEAFRLKKDK